MDSLFNKRKSMVERQIKARGIFSEKVIDAMLQVKRDAFVPLEKKLLAYEDFPLPIGHGQTISQPYIVALMTELAEIRKGDRVLEIGTGSGYQCAVLSVLAGSVYSLERVNQLARRARETLLREGFENCEVIHRDGYEGLPEKAPFDVIVITAASPEIPEKLPDQLSENNGRMVLPVGQSYQKLVKIMRSGKRFEIWEITDVAFVPMLGGTADDA